MGGPLGGLIVIDQTQAFAGPYCSMMLADMGASVIKMERPQVGDQRGMGPPFIGGESTYYLAVNRNKRSMTLNVAAPEGQAICGDWCRGPTSS